MSRRPTRMAARALWLVLLVAAGCDELGNPPPAVPTRGTTPLVEWRSPVVVLRTGSRSVPPSEAAALLRTLPPGSLSHREEAETGALTLVTVEPRWPRPVPAGTVRLVTQLRLPDGAVVTRTWTAPTTQPRWHALLALPAAPTEAATALAP